MNQKYVAYYRVSTDKQGISGLGMDAQEFAINTYLKGVGGELEKSFKEVETGKRKDRPELMAALSMCRERRAILLIAKLDRLARNAAFLLGLRDSGVEFVACDMPTANRLTVGILACVAEHEREMISQRTKDGLAAAKRRGIRLGNPNPAAAAALGRAVRSDRARNYVASMAPVIEEVKAAGVKTLRGIAKCLNARGFKTPHGRAFGPQSVANLVGTSPVTLT